MHSHTRLALYVIMFSNVSSSFITFTHSCEQSVSKILAAYRIYKILKAALPCHVEGLGYEMVSHDTPDEDDEDGR